MQSLVHARRKRGGSLTDSQLDYYKVAQKDKINEKYIVRNPWCGSLFVFVELGRLDGLARLGW